jgi:trehalose utilization protein
MLRAVASSTSRTIITAQNQHFLTTFTKTTSTLTTKPTITPHSPLKHTQTRPFSSNTHHNLDTTTQPNQIQNYFTKIKKSAQKYTKNPFAVSIPVCTGWSFSNSSTFENDIAESVKSVEKKQNPPPPPSIFSNEGRDGLKSEAFGSWIRAILSQSGHFDINTVRNDIEMLGKHHEDIEAEIERAHIEPEHYLWCKDFLDQIFRFSNYEFLGENFDISIPVEEKLELFPKYEKNEELFSELIRYKTFIEKERYRYFRSYEELIEHTAEMSQSLDLMNVALAQANPYNEKMERYQSSIMTPVYRSVHDSLISVIDVSSILDKPLLHAQLCDEQVQKLFNEKLLGVKNEHFPPDVQMWTENDHEKYNKLENAVYSRALHILRQEAISLNQANVIAESLQQLYHEVSWDFKTFYDPNCYQKIIKYAKREKKASKLPEDQREEYFLRKASKLPVPPLLDLNAYNILNLFVQKRDWKEINNKLRLEYENNLSQNDGQSNDPPKKVEFDPERVSITSKPGLLLFRLVNDNKETVIPSIHDRSLVHHEFLDIIKKVQTRPYVLYGLQQRVYDNISKQVQTTDDNERTVHDIRNAYVRSAREQQVKRQGKVDKKNARKKRAEKKLMKLKNDENNNNNNNNDENSNGFENFDNHKLHPNNDDIHVLEHENDELFNNAIDKSGVLNEKKMKNDSNNISNNKLILSDSKLPLDV